jgi:hypothetical protein
MRDGDYVKPFLLCSPGEGKRKIAVARYKTNFAN